MPSISQPIPIIVPDQQGSLLTTDRISIGTLDVSVSLIASVTMPVEADQIRDLEIWYRDDLATPTWKPFWGFHQGMDVANCNRAYMSGTTLYVEFLCFQQVASTNYTSTAHDRGFVAVTYEF